MVQPPQSRFGKSGQVALVGSLTLAPTNRANPRQKLRFRQTTICRQTVVTPGYRADLNKEIHHEVPTVRCTVVAENDLHRGDSHRFAAGIAR